jgi:hypothetical protein
LLDSLDVFVVHANNNDMLHAKEGSVHNPLPGEGAEGEYKEGREENTVCRRDQRRTCFFSCSGSGRGL